MYTAWNSRMQVTRKTSNPRFATEWRLDILKPWASHFGVGAYSTRRLRLDCLLGRFWSTNHSPSAGTLARIPLASAFALAALPAGRGTSLSVWAAVSKRGL